MANMSIDPNQLLTLCHRIRELMDNLESSIRLVGLRLTTLSYVKSAEQKSMLRHHSMVSVRCLDDLIELCNMSQQFVNLLEELQVKLDQSAHQLNAIDYQIATQQLAFFTTEWYDNIMAKLNETLDRAGRHKLSAYFGPNQTGSGLDMGDDGRLEEALGRLRQSMRENERLISAISSNINHSRVTIESIYDSLRAARSGLDQGQRDAREAGRILRSWNRWRCVWWILLVLVLGLLPALYLVFGPAS